MKDQDREVFSRMMAVLAESFSVPVRTSQVEAYWMALEDLPIEQVEKAVHLAIRNISDCYGKLPLPGKLRQLIDDSPSKGLEAWDRISQCLKNGQVPCVPYRLDNPLAHASLRAVGGFDALGRMSKEDFDVWGKKNFLEAYAMFASKGIPESMTGNLPGTLDYQSIGGQLVTSVLVQMAGPHPLKALSAGEPGKNEKRMLELTKGIGDGNT